MNEVKFCLLCSSEFRIKTYKSKFCTKYCADKWWRENNKERNKELKLKHYHNNRDYYIVKKKEYDSKHREEKKQYSKIYYEKNKIWIKQKSKTIWKNRIYKNLEFEKLKKDYKKKRYARNFSQKNLIKDKVCSNCKYDKNLQFHHLDYNFPEKVITLCAKCHINLHQKNIKI